MLQILIYPLLPVSPLPGSELGNKCQSLVEDTGLVKQGSGTGLSELVTFPRPGVTALLCCFHWVFHPLASSPPLEEGWEMWTPDQQDSWHIVWHL